MKKQRVGGVLLGLLCSISVSVWPDRPVHLENASEVEQQLVVRAYAEVKAYYEELGYSVPGDVAPSVVFQDRISLDGRKVPDALGLFDPDSMGIRLVHFESEKFQQRGFLGAPATIDLYYSIIVHEFSHFINALVSPGLLPPADELIASTVQLELMEPDTRTSIYESTDVKRFASCRDITLSNYWFAPDNFILACYCYSEEHPGMFMRFLNQTNPKIKDPLFID